MTKPSPYFVMSLVGIILAAFTLWVIATLHESAVEKRNAPAPMCVSETGHKKVPCP